MRESQNSEEVIPNGTTVVTLDEEVSVYFLFAITKDTRRFIPNVIPKQDVRGEQLVMKASPTVMQTLSGVIVFQIAKAAWS